MTPKNPLARPYVPARIRKAEVKRAIIRLEASGKTATVRAIGREVNLLSSASVHRYLRMLVKDGVVRQTVIGHYTVV